MTIISICESLMALETYIKKLKKYKDWVWKKMFYSFNEKMKNTSCLIVVVQSLRCVQLFVTPWIASRQAFLSFTISWSLLKFMSIESVMPSNHLILFGPLLLLPSICPSISFFSDESAETNMKKNANVFRLTN